MKQQTPVSSLLKNYVINVNKYKNILQRVTINIEEYKLRFKTLSALSNCFDNDATNCSTKILGADSIKFGDGEIRVHLTISFQNIQVNTSWNSLQLLTFCYLLITFTPTSNIMYATIFGGYSRRPRIYYDAENNSTGEKWQKFFIWIALLRKNVTFCKSYKHFRNWSIITQWVWFLQTVVTTVGQRTEWRG